MMGTHVRDQRGFSLIELLIGMTLLLLIMAGVFVAMVENARINKAQKMAAQVQANARSCLSMVVQKLRGTGWDPMNAGINLVTLDPDLGDTVSEIEVFADLDLDGATNGNMEQVWIRHINGTVEWRPTNDPMQAFRVVATDISNDADGDGTIEPMFVPDSVADPTRITVQVTAQSPAVDPTSGEFIRYTVSSDVVLRKRL